MSIEMSFDNLDELIKECQKYASESEITKVDKKILQKCGEKARQNVSAKMKRSKDVSKSGRDGSRTFIHSADAVPVSKVKKKGNRMYVVVGWDKGDNSSYFYTKFIEWGTSKLPPFPVFLPTAKSVNSDLHAMGLEEYEKFLKFLER